MNSIRWNRILFYIALSYGWSWTMGFGLDFTEIQYGSLPASLFIALLYMPGPALAAVMLYFYYRDMDFASFFGFAFRKIKYAQLGYVFLYFLCFIFFTLSFIVLFGNILHITEFGFLDFSETSMQNRLIEITKRDLDFKESPLPLPPFVFLLIGLLAGMVSGFTINLPFMLGEELGWRGFLLRETQPMGYFGSNFFTGIVWGLWHLPLILMGHNYPHYPIIGQFMMMVLCIALSFILSYIRLKSRSILAPCAFHGMLNATGALLFIFIVSGNELYASVAGLAGVMASVLLMVLVILFEKSTFFIDYRKLP